MPTLRTRVNVTNDFPRITRQINETAREAVAIGASVGGRVAAEIAAQRSETGAMASIRVSSPSATEDGWEAAFLSPVHHAWFQNYGTLGSRRKPLKEAPRERNGHMRTRAPGTGVKPLRFLDKGRAAGRRAMLDHIRKGLPK